MYAVGDRVQFANGNKATLVEVGDGWSHDQPNFKLVWDKHPGYETSTLVIDDRFQRVNRYTVNIEWGGYGATGSVEVVVESVKAENALTAALAHNHTRMITEGGAGISFHSVRYTPKAELTEEDEFG